MPETPVLRTLAFECIIQCVRLMSRLTWLVGLLCASAPVLFQQDRLPASDPDRDNDARAIYSWLITHSADQDKLYLIAPETSQSDYPLDRCLEIPPDHTADFREIRADFDRRKNAVHAVPKSLSTPAVCHPGSERYEGTNEIGRPLRVAYRPRTLPRSPASPAFLRRQLQPEAERCSGSHPIMVWRIVQHVCVGRVRERG